MSVSPTGCHSQDTRTEPVPSVNFCPILQQDVGNSQVTKPGWRIRDMKNEKERVGLLLTGKYLISPPIKDSSLNKLKMH